MNNVNISSAKIKDAQEIRILETSVWNEECTNKYDIPMYIRFGYVYIAKTRDQIKNRNKIVGAICAYKTKDDEIYVCDWFVEKKFRGKNIGIRLYKKLIISVKCSIVTFLDPMRIATVHAHEKLGFKIIKRVKNAYGIYKGLESGERLFVRRD
jgi:ribosomal protein S18 acetylase RimI-like enzyme